MKKRLFRRTEAPQDASQTPEYPTLDAFDQGRRAFLARLGATVIGASTLSAAALSGCGDRGPVGNTDQGPDLGPLSGVARPPDAGLDQGEIVDGDPTQPDGRGNAEDAGRPDGEPLGGDPPLPDAAIDMQPPLAGEPLPPDAAIDSRPDQMFPPMGGKPAPDAAIDQQPDGEILGGVAPMPDLGRGGK